MGKRWEAFHFNLYKIIPMKLEGVGISDAQKKKKNWSFFLSTKIKIWGSNC